MKWINKIATINQWASEISNREQKEQIAIRVASRAKDGDTIGVGSGSTAYLAVQEIGKRVQQEKIAIIAIPTSIEVAMTCALFGIPITTLVQSKPDWAFDGADEVDKYNNLIKGRGGAMFFEKLVLSSSPENYILVDDSKFVNSLGEKFPVPIEVYPSAVNLVETRLVSMGATEVKLRLAKGKDGPIITESGNLILDTRFTKIELDFEKEIKAIPGVIENGLFIGYNINIVKA